MNQSILQRMLALLVTCLLFLSFTFAQQPQAVKQSASRTVNAGASDELLAKLPSRLREAGRKLLVESDDKRRAQLADDLAKEPKDAMEFLLTVLDSDESALVRRAIVDRLGKDSAPQVREALKRHAVSDRDVGVAILAADRFRALTVRDASTLLLQRMELAQQNNDSAGLRELEQEQERWISLINGVMLPSFMRVVPPLFSLKSADQSVRFLAFGDFGTGSDAQKKLALVMQQFAGQKPFDFGLTLGDNFYQEGMTGPSDPRWRSWWEEIYGPLGIKFYATLGNHDWYGADSPASEILYSQQSTTWRMPAPYYTFTAGPAQFFAIDTNEMSEAQLAWLKDELTKSHSRWKIVYGHHPIFSASASGDNQKLKESLLPILAGRADLYLTGHNHNLQHLKPVGGLHFLIVGGGGQKLDKLKASANSLFAAQAFGFAVLEADQKELRFKVIGADGKELYTYIINK